MRRIICCLLSCVLMLSVLMPLGVSAEELHFSNYDDLLSYIQSQKDNPPDRVDFTCDKALYSFLSDNSFKEFYRLLLQAGIDIDKSYFYYMDSSASIQLKFPAYVYYPWAECGDESEIVPVLNSLLAASDKLEQGVILICSDELAQKLRSGSSLEYYAACCGVDYCNTKFLTDSIIKISSIQFFSKPYAQVDDYAQFASAVSDFADQNIDDFYIVFDPDLFSKITGSSVEMAVMESSSKLFDYWASIYQQKSTIHYYGVEYTDMARVVCSSSDDVKEAIKGMGTAGITDFELIFPYETVFKELTENDFTVLKEIEREAGMTGADMSYGSDRIIFKNAEITSEVVALESLADAVSYTESQVAAGSKDIHLFCTADLYQDLLGDLTAKGMVFFRSGSNRIYDLISQAGIDDYELSTSEAIHVINIHINRLFPGTAVIQAVRSGDSSSLTSREVEAWEAAEAVASQAAANTELETAKIIHDWLCEHVVYTNDETTDEDDNAIGAILNGEANCDGYTDAFYLIGSLAGLNVRYQHGDSYNKGLMQFSSIPVTHIWNLLEIDGEWRMVDVTWDDEDEDFTYIWFNVGNDIAKRMHFWNEDMTVALSESTERVYNGISEFYIRTEADLSNAVDAAAERKLQTIKFLFDDLMMANLVEDAKNLVARASNSGVLTYSWEEKMGLLGFYNMTWK